MRQAVLERAHPANMGGVQKLFRFSNGYGASVVQFPYSYGYEQDLWELAVIRYIEKDSTEFDIVYDTPVTSDVEGYLSEAQVDSLLDWIEILPPVME